MPTGLYMLHTYINKFSKFMLRTLLLYFLALACVDVNSFGKCVLLKVCVCVYVCVSKGFATFLVDLCVYMYVVICCAHKKLW